MLWTQIIFGAVLVAVLLLLAFFYAWRQVRVLRRLRGTPDLPADERNYEGRKAWRRLVSSGLILVLAVLLGGALLYLEGPAERLKDAIDVGQATPLSPEQQQFARLYGWYWIAFLLVLLVVVVLAALDLFATRRYGLREQRKLQAERRDMIERQVARLRQERNERN